MSVLSMAVVLMLSGCGKNHDFSIVEEFPLGMSKTDFLEKIDEKDVSYFGDRYDLDRVVEDIENAGFIVIENHQFLGYKGHFSFGFEPASWRTLDDTLIDINFSPDTRSKEDYDNLEKRFIEKFGEPTKKDEDQHGTVTTWEQEDYKAVLLWDIYDNLDDPENKLTEIGLYFSSKDYLADKWGAKE